MRTWWSVIAGCVVLAMSLAAWLYGEVRGIDTSIIWTITGPVVVALMIGTQVATAADAAQRAAAQTNGALDARVQASVAQALAARDAARTRQRQGDISSQGDVSRPA